jgi:hypothetical protein
VKTAFALLCVSVTVKWLAALDDFRNWLVSEAA